MNKMWFLVHFFAQNNNFCIIHVGYYPDHN